MVDKELQAINPPVAASWTATPRIPDSEMVVELAINVPEHATVVDDTPPGQIRIDGIRLPDLISLRDTLNEEINRLKVSAADTTA